MLHHPHSPCIIIDLLQKAPDSRQPLSTIQDNTFAIKMPPAIKKRGRPKGAGITVIGLPKKKGKASSKPKAFVLKSEWEKTKGVYFLYSRFCVIYTVFPSRSVVMLNWFVDEEVTERAVRGGDLIEEHEMECCPEKIPRKCLDDNVCIAQIKKFFTFDGWSLLQNSIDTLLVHGNWTCSICCIDLSTSESIGCDI